MNERSVLPFDQRDPAFIRAHMGKISAYVEGFHRTEIFGLERVPEGPALLIGNHSGGVVPVDMFALMAAWWREAGPEAPAYGLMHAFTLRDPLLGPIMRRFGAVPASQENARAILERGAKLLVYPGGDIDSYRPHSRRAEIHFGGRTGFVRLALRARVPLVPIVSAGAHEIFHVLSDGQGIARALGLDKRLRMKAFPLVMGLPWGLWVGPLPFFPLPVRMGLKVLEPMRWPDAPEDADRDPTFVKRCAEQVLETMSAELLALHRSGRYGRRWLRG